MDTKVSIAAFSVAVTAGLWALFSNDALVEMASAASQTPSEPPLVEGQVDGLAPLPTLVPLVEVDLPAAGASSALSGAAPAAVTAGEKQPALRAVSAPTAVIVQKQAPRIDQPSVQVSSGGRSGGGSSAPEPVTRTRTSR